MRDAKRTVLPGLGGEDIATCRDEVLVAEACLTSAECCTANCDPASKLCEPPKIACTASGQACANGPDCCTLSCIGETCANKLCVADNLACAIDAECRSGKCAPDGKGGGLCASLNPGGPLTDGNPCATNSDCASKLCSNGICTSSSFCQQNGDVCAADFECCGGACTIAATSVTVCQPSSGCHVTGDLCRADSDCCGWSGSPDPKMGFVHCRKDVSAQEFGRCDKGTACTEPGTICEFPSGGGVCNASNACCVPVGFAPKDCQNDPTKCCGRDALGVPRCLIKPVDCSGAKPAAGTVCCGAPPTARRARRRAIAARLSPAPAGGPAAIPDGRDARQAV